MKKISILLIVCIFYLCGCGSKQVAIFPIDEPAGRTVITLDTWQKTIYDLEMVVAEFNRTDSGYFVQLNTYENMDVDAYFIAQSQRILSGNGSDIIDLYNDYNAVNYIENDLLERLDPYIESDIRKDEYIDYIFDLYRYKGATYGVLGCFEIIIDAASKDMFPTGRVGSFEELCSVTEKKQPKSLRGWNGGLEQNLWALYNLEILNFDNPEQLRREIEFAEKYVYNPEEQENRPLPITILGEDVAFYSMYISEVRQLMTYFKEWFGTYGKDYVALNRPQISGLTLGINKNSDKKAGAWKFIRFALSKEGQEQQHCGQKVYKYLFLEQLEKDCEYLEQNNNISKDDAKEAFLKVVENCIGHGRIRYLNQSDYKAWLILQEEIQGYLDGIRELDETLERMQLRMQEYH